VIQVRAVSPDDWELLREARLRALIDAPRQFGTTEAETRALTEAQWRQLAERGFAGDEALVLVALDGTEPVGMGVIERDPGERRRHRARIWGVWVASAARGRGLGRRLLTVQLEWAKERDVVTVYLDVVVGNDPARSLYQRLGFVRRDLDPYSLRIDDEFVAQERLVLLLRVPGRGG
jgi:ribosomal protein S18 acetylase RimI-like enzyme